MPAALENTLSKKATQTWKQNDRGNEVSREESAAKKTGKKLKTAQT